LLSAITEFPLPTAEMSPDGMTVVPYGNLTAGPDGNLWFREYFSGSSAPGFPASGYPPGGEIGRITPAGAVTEFPLAAGAGPQGDLTVGPDGNLWFPVDSELSGEIGRITPAGVIAEFPLPAGDGPQGDLTVGPDGNLWFADDSAGYSAIGRIDPTSPRVTKVVAVTHSRLAITAILLGFDEALDPASARKGGFYGLAAGAKSRQTVVFSHGVKIARVSYDRAAHTVRLKLAVPQRRPVQVTVRAGLVAADGMSSFSDFTAVVR
jgi:hypothetical protein